MPIMATANLKDKHIYNTMEFKVRGIKQVNDKCLFTINGQELSEDGFSKAFISSLCLTVYKYQGSEINLDYNIFDINRMVLWFNRMKIYY